MTNLKPVRLRLSRAKGFDLQALSQATNGLPAVKVTRPGPFGNPYTLQDAADVFDCRKGSAHEHAVRWFREWIETPPDAETFGPCHIYDGMAEAHAKIHAGLPGLRGKNLACFCAPEFDCHADVLLELANGPIGLPAARVQVRNPNTGNHHVLDTDTARTVETRRDGPAPGVAVLTPSADGDRHG